LIYLARASAINSGRSRFNPLGFVSDGSVGFTAFDSFSSVSGHVNSSITRVASSNERIGNDRSTFDFHGTTIDNFGIITLKANRTTKRSTSISVTVTRHFYLKEKLFLTINIFKFLLLQ
jgi:hypothetical protein